MNNIIINNNILENYTSDYLIISNNEITFLKDGEYNITYIDSDKTNITYIVEENVSIKLFIMSKDNSLDINDTFILNEYSTLELSKFYHNKKVSENIVINLNGKYSYFSNKFSSICENNDNYHMIINHNNNYTKSIISNKCISCDESKIDIIIDSILPKGNINCTMDQNTKILTLGEADAKISPNMFIDEESVEAKHGSVISSFNEEEIFYLTSRGINKEEAINLLIKGFIFSNLILNMENKAIVYECINSIRR